jgi:hypothetical protein
MFAARKRREHRACICGIDRLAQCLPVEIDDGVGRDDERGGLANGDRRTFCGGMMAREIERRESGSRPFIDIARYDADVDPERPEQLVAPR